MQYRASTNQNDDTPNSEDGVFTHERNCSLHASWLVRLLLCLPGRIFLGLQYSIWLLRANEDGFTVQSLDPKPGVTFVAEALALTRSPLLSPQDRVFMRRAKEPYLLPYYLMSNVRIKNGFCQLGVFQTILGVLQLELNRIGQESVDRGDLGSSKVSFSSNAFGRVEAHVGHLLPSPESLPRFFGRHFSPHIDPC